MGYDGFDDFQLHIHSADSLPKQPIITVQAVHLSAENSHLKKPIRQDLFPSDKAQEGTVKGLAPAGCQAPCLEVNVKLTPEQGSDVSLSPQVLGVCVWKLGLCHQCFHSI